MPEMSPPTGPVTIKTVLLANFAFLLIFACGAHGQFTILNQPPISNRPYPSAYYNQKLPNAGAGGPLNHLMPNSSNIVNTVMKNGGGNLVTGSGAWNTPGTDDGQHKPIYFGKSTDPVFQLSGCASPMSALNGIKFHAPSAAPYNQGSFDKEIVIWDQTTNQTIGLFGGTSTTTQLPACSSGTTSSPCNVPANGGYCSADNWATGRGVGGGDAVSTAGISPFGNIIRLTEIVEAGHINHGIRGVTTCVDTNNGLYPSKVVFPATQLGGAPANTCANAGVSSANRPPNGALFFLDYTQAQLDCFNPTKPSCSGINKLASWQYMLIEAATLYGITIEDTGNGSSISLPGIESLQAYAFYDSRGYSGSQTIATTFTNYMNKNCSGASCSIVTRSAPHSLIQWNINAWAGISPVNGGDVISHMHVADPCVALGLQGMSNGCASAPPVSSALPAPTGLTATVQ